MPTQVADSPANRTVLGRRKPFSEVVSLPSLVVCVLTLGLWYVFLRRLYRMVPELIEFRDDRVFAAPQLPPEGIELELLERVTVTDYKVMNSLINRVVMVDFERQGEHYVVSLNHTYYSKEDVNRAIEFFGRANAAVNPPPATKAAPLFSGRMLLKMAGLLLVIAGFGFAAVAQFTRISEEVAHSANLERQRLEAMEQLEQPEQRAKAQEELSQVESWQESNSRKVGELRQLQLAAAGVGVLGLLLFFLTPSRPR